MKQLTTLIFSLLFLVIGVSQVWALPNCVGSYLNPFSNLMWTECKGSHTFGSDSERAGDIYSGEFKSGNPHRQGTYTWGPNSELAGDKYFGEHKNNLMHGQGTFTFADGSKRVGTWENNKLNGYAITYYADGSINQEGVFKDDVLVEEE